MRSCVSKGSEVSLVKGFINLSEQLNYACAYDACARELPAEYEGHWIAELVRSFALARGQGEASPVDDYWQEALVAATEALREADARGADANTRTAFVKTAVRSRLTDLNRRLDRRAGVVTSAEDLPRDEEDDGDEHLIEERFEDSAFQRLPRRLTSDIGLALMLLDAKCRRTWRAFRDTNGSSREIAAYLGDTSYKTVQRTLLPELMAAFESGLRSVRLIRGKVF